MNRRGRTCLQQETLNPKLSVVMQPEREKHDGLLATHAWQTWHARTWQDAEEAVDPEDARQRRQGRADLDTPCGVVLRVARSASDPEKNASYDSKHET